MSIKIEHIEYYLPETIVTNDEIEQKHPKWDLKNVAEKSGIYSRHIAEINETAFDLACKGIEKLIANQKLKISEIDGIMFCTQSPDYIMPSNAFLIHNHFEFENRVWAFDYNLACSGYIYGLAIARGMISTNMAKKILLINADTYSKYINVNDRSTSVLFGDGAAISIISTTSDDGVLDIALASAGKEFNSFYIPGGGCRIPKDNNSKIIETDKSGNERTLENIHMNGFAVWKFISKMVPDQIEDILLKNNLKIDDIDLFVFHQASMLTLNSLIKVLKIDRNKVFFNLEKIGNTVSASIPIAYRDAELANKLRKGNTVLLSGFGVGLSWGSIILKY